MGGWGVRQGKKTKEERIRGAQTKLEECEEDYMDKRKQITGSNQVKAGNRVHVLTLSPSVHVL